MPQRQGTAALQNLTEFGRARDGAVASWSAALPCRFSNDLEGCFDSTNAPKVPCLKEGIRRFKWWAIVALAIVALLVFALLFPRPLRDPVSFTFVGWTNIQNVPHAAVAVSNQSSKSFSVHPVAVTADQRKQLLRSKPGWLQLASGANGSLNLPVTPGIRREEFQFICFDTDPNRLQIVPKKAADLMHLHFAPKNFKATLVVTQ
jgi:hypothetical protein